MFFKNLIIYTMQDNSSINQINNELLQNIAFVPCGTTDSVRKGFVSPIDSDELMLTISEHSLLKVRTESKILPSYVINKKLADKVEQLEQKLQRKLKKSERLSLKDELMIDLLPQAFTKDQYTYVWINHRDNFIAVSSSSFKNAEDVLTLLRKELGSLAITPLSSEQPADKIFTQWLREDKAAEKFIIHNDALLVDPIDTGKIKLTKEDLTTDAVKNYLDAGRTVESLSLIHKEQTSFTINTSIVFSKIGYSSEMLDKNDDFTPEEKERRVEADFLLVAEELSSLISDLMKSFE